MKKLSSIGTLLKKLYRLYSGELLTLLQQRGYTDLRPSFLEVLLYICEHDGPTIKAVGEGCGLKKQTMTSHLNELEKRDYIYRQLNENDKRGQRVFLTENGQRFRLNLFECINEIEQKYSSVLGDVELDRVSHLLKNFHSKLVPSDEMVEQSLF